jgi:hypothetical protein
MRRAKIVRRRPAFSPRSTMLGRVAQRKASRVFVRLLAWIRVDSSPHDEHVAFVRDISPRGIFFYSDFKPTSGERIAFVLQYRKDAKRIKLHVSGSVVRVEQATSTSAIGIAVAFDCEYHEVPRTPNRAS